MGGFALVMFYARPDWSRAARAALLGASALTVLVSALSYFDDWRGQPPAAWLHEHDFFHYYFGAKYFPELGHMRLYLCTAAALQERAAAHGQASPVKLVRRLEAPGETLSGAALASAAVECRSHFSAARWQMFSADIETLEHRLSGADAWQGMLVDLGNNSPPSWNLYATPLANALPLNAATLNYWPLVDQLLLFVVVPLVVWRTFGGVALMAYGLVYCASPLAFLGWTGGSFGRADWYVALLCGLAALATRRMAWAGALLALAAAWRVFPLLFMLAVPLVLYVEGQRAQAIRFILAGAGVLAFMVGASALMFGATVWSEFATVMALRISPYGANTIGLGKLAACWNVLEWPQFTGGSSTLRDANEWLETLAGDAARRHGVGAALLVTLSAATLLLRRRTTMFASVWVGLLLLFGLLTPFTYYYVVLALLPLATSTLEGRQRGALLAVVMLGLLALRAVSVPFAAELGRATGFYEVSLHSSQVLLLSLVLLVVVLALTDLIAARSTARPSGAVTWALGSALAALLLAVIGYRPAPFERAYFHDLAALGALHASPGVTVRERLATASWPGAHFFEVALGSATQVFDSGFDTLPAGRYRVSLVTTSAPGYGQVRVRIGVRQLQLQGRGEHGRAEPHVVLLGDVDLDGHSRMEVRALDARGARMGLSGLLLEPLPTL